MTQRYSNELCSVVLNAVDRGKSTKGIMTFVCVLVFILHSGDFSFKPTATEQQQQQEDFKDFSSFLPVVYLQSKLFGIIFLRSILAQHDIIDRDITSFP